MLEPADVSKSLHLSIFIRLKGTSVGRTRYLLEEVCDRCRHIGSAGACPGGQ
jgi:hypothetical protein